jgi:hypothetical protein
MPGSGAGMSDQQPTPSTVVGRFTTPDAARAAIVRLEAAGFDGDAIHLEGIDPAVPRDDVAAEQDLHAVDDVAKGAGIGAGLGAAAGVAAGLVTGVVTGDAGTAALIGTTGAVGGSVVGGLAGTYAGLPVAEEAWTTYELDPSDAHPVTVSVRVDSPDRAEAARAALRG